MLKAIKECLKNWLTVHERLYWYIVIGLAVLGFGIVTALGCAKLEKANAAETSDGVYYPAVSDVSWGDYSDELETAISDCDLFWISHSNGNYYYGFINSVAHQNPRYVWSGGGSYSLSYTYLFAVSDTSLQVTSFNNRVNDWSANWAVASTSGNNFLIGTTYTYTWEPTSPRLKSNNLSYPVYTPPASYSKDAPYVKFDELNVKNDIASGKGKFLESLKYYDNFIVPAYWEYVGYMENYLEYPGAEYLLEVEFTVELPRLEYIQSLANKLDVDIVWVYNMVKWGSELIDLWNKDALALKNTYQFRYNFPVVPDDNGNFSFRLSYQEIENLIKYWSEAARNEFNSYDSETLGVLLSFLHVDSCCISVKTTTADSVLYGRATINHFERGVYDACVEVELDLDILNKSEEEIDKIIQDSVSAGYEQYYKELEDRINSLEGQLGDVSNIQAGFGGNLETTDLWSGFTGLVQGLGSIAPAVYGLSNLTGIVLAFMPLEIAGIMSTTLLAICVIAIIKAIRG